ncbi:MAG: DNA polymerase III subunit gamma/tau [Spirochaetia bacterium]|nr:DNA polymerase III subunit gamma/tau [Spirochaetia bacterium]
MANLARKYRPSSFKDLMGQLQTARALKNALEFNQLNHAYLFFGSRGVGKTTTARILARSINCQTNGISTNPCGSCDNCIEISEGRNIDVIEMDAASNRGIEHIRDLRENVRFAPMKSSHKIYIIDEVHMLTNESFNALLKTLEEPPEHVVFIMATTEYHKIPETILSRCQAFPFKKFSNHEIIERLAFILNCEKIEFEKEALIPIAIKGEGSMRDAISLLDRIITYSGNQKIKYDLVNETLGIIPFQLYINFLENLITKNAGNCLELINKLYYDGYNLKIFFFDFLDYVKNTVLIKKKLYKDSGYFTSNQISDLEKIIENWDSEELMLTFDIGYRLYNNWTYYNTTNSFEILINLEMAIIDIIDKLNKPSLTAIFQKLSRLEKSISEGKPFSDKIAVDAQPEKTSKPSLKPEERKKSEIDKTKPLPEIEDDIASMIQKEFGAKEEHGDDNLKIFNS